MKNEIVFITPKDARYGFSLAGVRQLTVSAQQAEELLGPIQKYTERHGFRYFQTSVEFALARVYQAKGDVIESASMFQKACKQADEQEYQPAVCAAGL